MKMTKQLERMLAKPGKKLKLKDHATDYEKKTVDKEEASILMQTAMESLKIMQDKLYSKNQNSVLIVLQAMDAAGKDSMVKHVMNGLNPTGVKVTPFGVPTDTERDHDYLWRHNLALPARGEIAIFLRSHYENVLVTKVHPEFILAERIPGYDDVKKITKDLYKMRYRQINDWERHQVENGTTIIKIFLHSSMEEQKVQLLERLDDPQKNWKFKAADLKERKLWPAYMDAYEEMINNTSSEYAPWYIVPADDRWFARLSVATIIHNEVDKLKIDYPSITADQKAALATAKEQLLNE